MICLQPVHEAHSLADVLIIKRRRVAFQVVTDFGDFLQHRLPVVSGGAHVLHGFENGAFQPGDGIGVHDAVNFQQNAGLGPGLSGRLLLQLNALQHAVPAAHHPEDRVHGQMNVEPRPLDHHAERIHEKRHVVVDHLHDGASCEAAIGGHFRVEHPDERHPRLALAREGQQRQRGARQVGRCALVEVFGRHIAVEAANETPNLHDRFVDRCFVGSGDDVFEGLILGVGASALHR